MATRAPVPFASEQPTRAAGSSRSAKLRGHVMRARELIPLTLRGATIAGLSLAALSFYGFGALDGVWYVAGIGLLGLCALTLCAVLATALLLKLRLTRRAEPLVMRAATETGRDVATGFALPGLRALVLIELSLIGREPSDLQLTTVREGGLLQERARFSDHGEVRALARTIVVRDVFGLASIGLRLRQTTEIDILPHAGALRSLPLLRSLSGGDDMPHPLGLDQGDRLELRRYAPGDPARFIHWKVFARTQKLVVRMPERALSRAQRVAAFLIAGQGDAASAAAARVALEEGAFGVDFRFGADGSPTPVREVAAALVSLRRSSGARTRAAESLEPFAEAIDREGPSSLVLFVPATEGPHVERVGTFLRRRARTARVVIGVDGITHDPAASLWSRFERIALAPSRSARVSSSALRELLASYRRYGCEVVVVDRESGRVLGDAHLRRAPDVKREVAA